MVGAFGKNQCGNDAQDDLELTNRALRVAKFDKIIVSVFNVVVSAVPFAPLLLGSAFSGLMSSISLSLAVTFGFTMLYTIQTLSSFVNAESSAVLSTLPILHDDFSLITLFSFIQSVDYIVVGSILSQVILVAYLTMSPLAILITLVASTMNAIFAVTIALWFSRMFQKNLLRGGRSKINTALRLVFIFMWGILLIGVGLLFSIPLYITPNLGNVLLSLDQSPNLLFGLLYPFSAGIVIAKLHLGLASASTFPASAAMVGYTLLVVIASKWSLGTIKRISQGVGVKITRVVTKDFSIKPRTPLLGYIMKDLKVASRNPATAFFFALPILEVVITSLLISNFVMLRTSAVLVGVYMGGIFALLLPLALLSAEGKGLEYTKTLPISSHKIIASKALVAILTYSSVPITLSGLALIKPLTSPSTILIPYLMTMAIASASILEIKFFLGSAAKGKIAAVISDLKKLTIGTLTLLAPEAVYATAFLLSFDHDLSLLTMTGTMVIELAIATYLLKHS